ncbi:MAG: hypothetical protein WC278_03950, partial [Bacilli bacterium]
MKNIKIVLIFILGIFISFSLMGCTDNNDNKLVVSITLNEDGEMIILYDDGTSDNLGDFSNDELISDFNDKLISQENKIKEQEEMLLAQESKIAEQETKIAEQETKIAEQEQILILQRTLIDNINELIESNEVITNEIYNNIYNAIINIEDFEN